MTTLSVTNREAWRRWLRQNHRREREIWLVCYNRHTGKPRIPYQDALEEALCFGWIDARVQRIDDERYAQKWTPRRPGSGWSELNRSIAQKLIKQRRMTKAGLEALTGRRAKPPPKRPASLLVPEDFERARRLNAHPWANFQAFAPSYRARYLGWIEGAKRDETSKKRIDEAVQLIAQGVKSLTK